MKITYPEFQKTINENAGEILLTAGGRAQFRLEEATDGVRFTPLSTGKTRGLNSTQIQRYLDIFNKTESTRTSDYTDKMLNASYVLSLIKLWIGQQSNSPRIDDDFNASEGNISIRSHLHRERSRELIKIAKALFRSKHNGLLFCEVCGFDFGKIYGDSDFIEAHHKTPLCDLDPDTKTKPSDLTMVCANCHRMLHRGDPWPTVDQLKQRLLSSKDK